MMYGTPDADIEEVCAASENAPDVVDDFDVGMAAEARSPSLHHASVSASSAHASRLAERHAFTPRGSARGSLELARMRLCAFCLQLAIAEKPENVAKLARRVQAVALTIRNAPRPGKKLLVLVRSGGHGFGGTGCSAALGAQLG